MGGAVERGRAYCLLIRDPGIVAAHHAVALPGSCYCMEGTMSDLKHSITLEPGDVFGILVGDKVAKCVVNAVAIGADKPKPPKVNQCNPRWADVPLTPKTSSTVCNVGCLVCSVYSLAMLWGYDQGLPTFLGALYRAGAFSGAYLSNPAAAADAIDVLRWDMLPVKDLYMEPYHDWSVIPANMGLIKYALEDQPVIVQVDYDPSDRDIDTHFVVAYQYIPPSLPGAVDDDLLIMDPMGGRYVSVLEYFNPRWAWDGSMREGVTKVARTVTGARIWTTASGT